MKKTWIKRGLIGLLSVGVLFGGLAAYAGNRFSHMSEADIARMRVHVIERVQKELVLDATQQARLNTLADVLQQQRAAIKGGGTNASPHEAMQRLIAGNAFDRAGAQALMDQKLAAVQKAGPEVLTAAADFYDSLRPDQQEKVRAFMARHGERFGRG